MNLITLKLYTINQNLLIKSNFYFANTIDPKSDSIVWFCYCCYRCWVPKSEIV